MDKSDDSVSDSEIELEDLADPLTLASIMRDLPIWWSADRAAQFGDPQIKSTF